MIQRPVLACLAASMAVVFATPVADALGWPTHFARLGADQADTRSSRAMRLLSGIGVSVEHLIVAGASTSDLPGVSQAADAYLISHGEALSSAEAAVNAARAAVAELERRPARDAAQNLPTLRIARQQLKSAEEALAARRNEAFEAVGASLSEVKRASLRRVRANAHRAVPAYFLLTERTEQEWLRLQRALEHVAAQQRVQREPDAAAQQVVLQAMSAEGVAVAKLRLEQERPTFKAALVSALAGLDAGANP